MTCRFRDRHRRPNPGWYVHAVSHRTCKTNSTEGRLQSTYTLWGMTIINSNIRMNWLIRSQSGNLPVRPHHRNRFLARCRRAWFSFLSASSLRRLPVVGVLVYCKMIEARAKSGDRKPLLWPDQVWWNTNWPHWSLERRASWFLTPSPAGWFEPATASHDGLLARIKWKRSRWCL